MDRTAPSSRASLHMALALVVLALAVRAIHLWESSDYPAFWAPIVDADRYDRMARDLARGVDPGLELHWQAPLHALLLSLVYRVAPASLHASLLAAKLAQAALGALTCLAVWRLASRFVGERWGALAAALYALYAPALFYESELLGTGLEMLWAASLPWLLLHYAERPRLSTGVLTGLGLALAVATRATFLPFAAGAFIWSVLALRHRPAARASLVALLSSFVLALAPLLAHRALSGGGVSLLPLSSGVNLHVGNNPERCRTLAARPGSEWQAIVSGAERAGAGRDPEAQDAHFRARFADYARAEPVSWAKGMLAKLGQLIAGRELPRNDDLYTAQRWSRWLDAQLSPIGMPFALLLAFAAGGAARLPRTRDAFPLLWMLATQALALVIVFVSSRHRMALVPPLAVLAALFVRSLGERSARRAVSFSLAAAVLALSLLLPDPCGHTRLSEADLHRAVAHRRLAFEQFDEAGAAFEQALQHEPESAETLLAAYYARLSARQPRAALPHIERYARLRPEDPNGQRLLEGTRALISQR